MSTAGGGGSITRSEEDYYIHAVGVFSSGRGLPLFVLCGASQVIGTTALTGHIIS